MGLNQIMTLVIGSDVTPVCDHCHSDWPADNQGRQLPGGHRWDGAGADGLPRIRLFCSTTCADAA